MPQVFAGNLVNSAVVQVSYSLVWRYLPGCIGGYAAMESKRWRNLWSSLFVFVVLALFASQFLLSDFSHASERLVWLLRATATEEIQSQIREPQVVPDRNLSTRGEGFALAQSEAQTKAVAALESLKLRVWQQDMIIRRHGTILRRLDADFEAWKRERPDQLAAAGDIMNDYRIEARSLAQELIKVGKDLRTYLKDFHGISNVSSGEHLKPEVSAVCISDGIREVIQRLPPGIVHATTDLYTRPIWGVPEETESAQQPKNLLAMAIGMNQKINVDRMIQKFPAENFTLLLFHYDESSYQDWNQFSWNSRAVHIQVPKQGKWWYAKRFLHPGLVEPYDYIFYFDEDLDLQSFNSLHYVEMVKKHDLEISQPALFPYLNVHYDLTRLVNGSEVHKRTNKKIYYFKNQTMCMKGSNDIPCAGFVEMMAPVFTRKAWKCVWHMIQNDLVLGWAMDWKFGACANGLPHEKIGVVDTDFVTHMSTKSLGGEGRRKKGEGKPLRDKVTARSWMEHDLFLERWAVAEKATGT